MFEPELIAHNDSCSKVCVALTKGIMKTAIGASVAYVALAILANVGVITAVSFKIPLIVPVVTGLVALVAYKILITVTARANFSASEKEAELSLVKPKQNLNWLSPLNWVNSFFNPGYTVKDGLTLLKKQIFEGVDFNILRFLDAPSDCKENFSPHYAVMFVDIVANGEECIAYGEFLNKGKVLEIELLKKDLNFYIDSLQTTLSEKNEFSDFKYSFVLAFRDANGSWSYAKSSKTFSELKTNSSTVAITTGVNFKAILGNMDIYNIRNVVKNENDLNWPRVKLD